MLNKKKGLVILVKKTYCKGHCNKNDKKCMKNCIIQTNLK